MRKSERKMNIMNIVNNLAHIIKVKHTNYVTNREEDDKRGWRSIDARQNAENRDFIKNEISGVHFSSSKLNRVM